MIGFLQTTLTFLSEPSKETNNGEAIPNTDSTAPMSEFVPAGPGLAFPYKSFASTDLVFLEPNTFVPLLIKLVEGSILKLVESSNGFFSIAKFFHSDFSCQRYSDFSYVRERNLCEKKKKINKRRL